MSDQSRYPTPDPNIGYTIFGDCLPDDLPDVMMQLGVSMPDCRLAFLQFYPGQTCCVICVKRVGKTYEMPLH